VSPLYEYQCDMCDDRMERTVKVDDRDNQNCSLCNSPLRRLITTIGGVSFKGSGWTPKNTAGSLAKTPERKYFTMEGKKG
jgi:putative FmdB family regulatory protein